MNSISIIEFSENLQTRMKQELDNLNAGQDEIIRIAKTLTFIRELISELKAFTRGYKFRNQAEEVHFFKEAKPVFLSQYFYYRKVFAIRLFDSFKDAKARQANYYQQLRELEKYVAKYLAFYEYCMSGNTLMDTHYFTRQHKSYKSPNRDERFSTGHDTKLAKILANELFKKYLLDMLKKSQTVDLHDAFGGLTWTGSKTDLIELIYALHSIEVFNNGTANLKLIASSFETLFNVSLGDYYRTFQDMRIRKRSQTPFLDQLQEKLIHRLNDLN